MNKEKNSILITEITTPPDLYTWNEYHSALNQISLLQHRRRHNQISEDDERELNELAARCRKFLEEKGVPELKLPSPYLLANQTTTL